jgi:hypothetical protein
MQTDTQPVDLEALRSSAKAFRDYPVCDSGGDPVYLTAQADELDAAADEIEALRAQIKSFRGVFTKLDKDENHAPGHAHRVVGIWDDDVGNAGKAGKICEWCAEWNSARAALGDAK